MGVRNNVLESQRLNSGLGLFPELLPLVRGFILCVGSVYTHFTCSLGGKPSFSPKAKPHVPFCMLVTGR